MITFTVAKSMPNLTRWEVDDWEAHVRLGFGIATVVVHTPAVSGDYRITKAVIIRNSPASSPGPAHGPSDKVGYLAVPSGAIDDQIRVTPGSINLVTGFTDAHAAYRAAAGGEAAALGALATWMLTSGVADATMAGS